MRAQPIFLGLLALAAGWLVFYWNWRFTGLVVSGADRPDANGLYLLRQQRTVNPFYLKAATRANAAWDALDFLHASHGMLSNIMYDSVAREEARVVQRVYRKEKDKSVSSEWQLASMTRKDGPIYYHTEKNAQSPADSDWCCGQGVPHVRTFGEGAVPATPHGQSQGPETVGNFVQEMASRPVSAVIMALCAWLYYRTATGQVDIGSMTISTVSVMDHGEYHRLVTSAFGHLSIMHIVSSTAGVLPLCSPLPRIAHVLLLFLLIGRQGFNMVTFYRVSAAEPLYGSWIYLQHSVLLMVASAAVACVIQHVRETRFGAVGTRAQGAAGYSAVLFAWIVVSAAQQQSYCPLPFGGFCLPTWRFGIPIPGVGRWIIPVNLSPFIALGVTQLMVPQASAVGHLSGILVGYLLAWGVFSASSGPFMAAFVLLALAFAEGYRAKYNTLGPAQGVVAMGSAHQSEPVWHTPRAQLKQLRPRSWSPSVLLGLTAVRFSCWVATILVFTPRGTIASTMTLLASVVAGIALVPRFSHPDDGPPPVEQSPRPDRSSPNSLNTSRPPTSSGLVLGGHRPAQDETASSSYDEEEALERAELIPVEAREAPLRPEARTPPSLQRLAYEAWTRMEVWVRRRRIPPRLSAEFAATGLAAVSIMELVEGAASLIAVVSLRPALEFWGWTNTLVVGSMALLALRVAVATITLVTLWHFLRECNMVGPAPVLVEILRHVTGRTLDLPAPEEVGLDNRNRGRSYRDVVAFNGSGQTLQPQSGGRRLDGQTPH